jgi:hypothetical protein
VILRAAWVLLTVTVPPVPVVPAEKKRSSASVVRVTSGTMVPAELVLHRAVEPSQLPVAAPEPVALPFVSQYKLAACRECDVNNAARAEASGSEMRDKERNFIWLFDVWFAFKDAISLSAS